MGMGFNPSEAFLRQHKTGLKLEILKAHPNYKDQVPIEGESLIAYTLRCAAHLVSPPQDIFESYDIECVDIADGILSLQKEIEERWNAFQESK